LHGWFPGGTALLASGSRDHHWRGAERLLKVHVDDRRAEEVLADATAGDASLDRSGKRILLVREGERWWRKGYRGERAAQVWLLDLESGEFTELLHEGVDCRWPIWHRDGNSFFFTKGDLQGFDLWRYDLPEDPAEAGQQTRLVDFEDDSVVFPTIARNSGLIVFRHLFDLYRFQPGEDETPQKIELTYAGDPNVDPDEMRRNLDSASEVAFTDDGLEIVVAAGGDLWGMDTELLEPVRITRTGAFEESPIFGPEQDSLITIAKREGQVDIYRIDRLHDEHYWWQPNEYRWTQLTDDTDVESDLQLGPHGEYLYYVRGLGALHRMPLEGEDEPVQLTDAFSAPDYDISPCGHWVAYAETDDNFNSDIWIRRTDGSDEPHNVSQHPDDDRAPRFSPDGKLLAFTGRRFEDESDIYYVWLQSEESERTARERKLEEALAKMKKNRKDEPAGGDEPDDENEGEDEAAAKDDSDAAKEAEDQATEDGGSEAHEPTVIDFEKITERIQRIPIINAYEAGLFWSPEGDKLAFYTRIDGERGTYTVTFPDELEPKKLTSQRISNPRWSKAAKGILGAVGGDPAKVDGGGKVNRYRFSAPQTLSRSERFRDGFETAWMIMRDRWYDPRHATRNWAAVKRKYIEMAAAAGDANTFGQVVQLMLGELNGSHNGFYPSRERGPQRMEWTDRTAHLGIRFDDAFTGPGIKVRDVLPGGPADRVESQLQPGDVIVRIDGTAVDPQMDLTQVLNGRLDRDIELDVERESEGDTEELEVTIRPISYGRARRLLYDQWLERNRKMVDEWSDGHFGYLHIRAMNMSSFYEFERQLYRVGYGREALVIDVRDNGGGSTTDLLLTALTQPKHAVTVPRGGGPGYPQGRMVFAVWQKPIIVLCNQNSYSNAEIFSHAIKSLGRGQLVGVETAGGVISTGSVRVTDVGRMRMPFRGWFVAKTGRDMEMNGARPHHILWPLPGEIPAGVDRQLEKAVKVLQQQIAENPEESPELTYAHEELSQSAEAEE
jgi:tricorn protease